MAITPADIQAQTFSEAKRGYDPAEVDVFLEQISAEVDAMLSKIVDLKNRLTSTEQQLSAAQAQIASLEEASAATMPAPVAPTPVQTDTITASERQISQVLIVAQQSADKILNDARDAAERIRTDADTKAREVIRQALAEKQNELDEIDRLKTSREDFRAEYKKLLQHFMDDAEAMFPAQVAFTNAPNGSAGTKHVDAPVSAPAPVTPPATPAVNVGDFGDLD